MSTKCCGAIEAHICSAVQPGLDFRHEGANPGIEAALFLLPYMKGIVPGCCFSGSYLGSGLPDSSAEMAARSLVNICAGMVFSRT